MSSEARRLKNALDSELQESAVEVGQPLVWSAVEQAIIDQICAETDRKVELQGLYDAAQKVNDKVKLSAEIRLLENSIERHLRRIRTELPVAESRATVKARQAAQARWGRSGA